MRKLAILTGAFSLGIFLAQYLLPQSWLLPCAAASLVVAFGRLFLPEVWGRRLLLVGVGLSLALGWDWLYIREIQQPMEELVGTETVAVMTVCDVPTATSYGSKFTARLEGMRGKVVCYGDEDLLSLQPGQTVELSVRFLSATHIRDDDVTSFTSKGVFLLAYQKGVATVGDGSMTSVRWWPVRVGHAMRARIAELFSGDTAGFLTAILTGDKTGLSQQASSDLSEAGLYHILAVSGMHCGFLLLLIRALVGRHRRRLLAGITVVVLVFYAMLTGGSPSVVRACVMLCFLLAAPLFRRESDGPTSLLSALFLILLANPFAAASISLQLSFGAMAGCLWLTPRLYRLMAGERRHGRVFSFLATGFSATMGALVWTVPLSAAYFGCVVLLSPLSNLLCLWAASVIFLTGLLAVALGFLWAPLGALVGLVPTVLIRYLLAVAHWLAGLPYHAVYTANPYLKCWLAFVYLLFAVAYLCKPRGRRKYVIAVCCGAVALAVTVYLGATRYQSALDVLVLDVGQGESVLLASDGAFALVDCGSANSWYDAGGVAADQLLSMGCRKLDTLVLTHCDSDHVNGVESLLARLPVETLLLPAEEDDAGLWPQIVETAQSYGVTVHCVETEETLSLGNAAMTILPPVGETADNERGLTVLTTLGETDLLITGDMSSATERKLLAAYDLPDIEYLVVGHHGSSSSTSNDLLDALTPETACISVGSNSYGHPTTETLRRLALHGCTVYRTDLHGTIHLSLN